MKTKRFLVDKLDRDKVVENAAKKGCTVKYHTVDDNEEFLDALTQKMVEELEELFECETKEQVINELADLEEVMDEFKKLVKVEQSDIDALRKQKCADEGGFKKRIYFEYIDVPENSEALAFYVQDPERYPEIVEEITRD